MGLEQLVDICRHQDLVISSSLFKLEYLMQNDIYKSLLLIRQLLWLFNIVVKYSNLTKAKKVLTNN